MENLQYNRIPGDSTVQFLPNGDALLFYPGNNVPFLCVERNNAVRTAITRFEVSGELARAARQFVEHYRQLS